MRRLLIILFCLVPFYYWSGVACAATMQAIDITDGNQPIANGTVTIIIVKNDLSTVPVKELLNSIDTFVLDTNEKGEFTLDNPLNTPISGSAHYVIGNNNQPRYCNGNITTLTESGQMQFECYFLGY